MVVGNAGAIEYQNRILETVPFYSGHPYLVPFVGANYDNSAKHRKLLLVGESHYMEKEVTVHRDVEGWYDYPPTEEHFNSTWCTPQITCKDPHTGVFRQTITRELSKILVNLSDDKVWDEVAFLNYFLRPSDECGKALSPKPRDREEAIKVFAKNTEILLPDVIVFVGVNAYKAADACEMFREARGEHKIRCTCVYNPSYGWWNRPMSRQYDDAKGKTAGAHFCDYLKEHWLIR